MNIYLIATGDLLHRNDLLLQCVKDYCEQEGILYTGEVQFYRTVYGKPMVTNPELNISISHCEKIWVCAVGLCPVGIDIEKIRPIDIEKIASHFFSENEQENLQKLASDGREKLFYKTWTLKECYSKLKGLGMRMKFSDIDTLQMKKKFFSESIEITSGYLLSVMSYSKISYKIIYGGEDSNGKIYKRK